MSKQFNLKAFKQSQENFKYGFWWKLVSISAIIMMAVGTIINYRVQ